MELRAIKKATVLALAIYIMLAAGFFFICGDQLDHRDETTDMVSPSMNAGEVVQGIELRQRFTAEEGEELRALTIPISTYGRTNTSTIQVRIEDMSGAAVGSLEIPTDRIDESAPTMLSFVSPVTLEKGENYDLVITSPDAAAGDAVTVWYGGTIALRNGEIPVQILDGEYLRLNGTPLDGRLCVSFTFRQALWFGTWYWAFAVAGGLLVAAYGLYTLKQAKKGKATMAVRVCAAFRRYGYLIRQLVSRDFKAKYKRSVLGVMWSLLNPILMMLVQYLVFSSLFRSDIPNFALYLISGIVCFNFFNEAVTMSLTSITGNAGLITKVYVPKYIYPFSRTLSSAVNLLLSMIPLFGVMLLTGVTPRPAILLLPLGLFCLFAFSLGIGMLLATSMVFFRDTQFLWGVVSMLWMYLSPIIYPESIIPAKYMTLYKCNPLYHIIRFIRIVLMDGISPEPKAYLLMMVASFVPLALGALVFWRKQDAFVVNL